MSLRLLLLSETSASVRIVYPARLWRVLTHGACLSAKFTSMGCHTWGLRATFWQFFESAFRAWTCLLIWRFLSRPGPAPAAFSSPGVCTSSDLLMLPNGRSHLLRASTFSQAGVRGCPYCALLQCCACACEWIGSTAPTLMPDYVPPKLGQTRASGVRRVPHPIITGAAHKAAHLAPLPASSHPLHPNGTRALPHSSPGPGPCQHFAGAWPHALMLRLMVVGAVFRPHFQIALVVRNPGMLEYSWRRSCIPSAASLRGQRGPTGLPALSPCLPSACDARLPGSITLPAAPRRCPGAAPRAHGCVPWLDLRSDTCVREATHLIPHVHVHPVLHPFSSGVCGVLTLLQWPRPRPRPRPEPCAYVQSGQLQHRIVGLVSDWHGSQSISRL